MAMIMDSGGLYQAPQISGSLPWSSGGGASGIGGPVGAAYNTAYNSALAMNQSNYNNIMQGYQQALAQQTSAQAAISAGYTDLYNNVLGKVQDTFGSQSNAINQAAAKETASGSQNLINSGLGNSTIMQSMQMGVESQRQQNQTGLSNQEAQMMGQYMSQLGLAGLANQQAGENNIMGTTQNQLNFMNSVSANYPNAGLYAQLAQAQAAGKYGGGGFASAGGGGQPGPKVGYVPSAPNWGAGGGDPNAYGGGGSGALGMQAPAAYAPNVPNPAWQPGGSLYGGGPSDYGDAALEAGMMGTLPYGEGGSAGNEGEGDYGDY